MSPTPDVAPTEGSGVSVIAAPRGGVPLGVWPRVAIILVGAIGTGIVFRLWWILPVAAALIVLVVWDLRRSGGRRDLRATSDGLVGMHRGKSHSVAWSQMAGVEFVRPRSAFSRPVAHVEVSRHDDPYDTAFVALVIFDKPDGDGIAERLRTVSEEHGVPFQATTV
ncbi:hypothetical protein [Allobranchiibius huperziae]|uniref:PH domain-containing protein n=1 Tax=Allobranchiibius huperziae TaxID=1874116 RepID=A0A853DMD2_9MICO|nr:hypothetical protein [Allobranchiibius huperziae]NYJ76154.1 hypothetical protein [Allobranchiibius huperziae]